MVAEVSIAVKSLDLVTVSRVHCPVCNRVLAVRLEDGSLEVRQGSRYRVTVEAGSVECMECRRTVRVPFTRRLAELRALV